MTGTIKWFNNQKGYGFISSKDSNDVFVHFADINGQELDQNEEVMFDTIKYGELLRVINVQKV